MNRGRFALLVTCVMVAGLCTWFALSRWDDANRIATITSALGAVAAVGVAVWATLRMPSPHKPITVKDTGKASGRKANTGLVGTRDVGTVHVERTGDATAEGEANSGVRLD